jgi:hypothetical protein
LSPRIQQNWVCSFLIFLRFSTQFTRISRSTFTISDSLLQQGPRKVLDSCICALALRIGPQEYLELRNRVPGGAAGGNPAKFRRGVAEARPGRVGEGFSTAGGLVSVVGWPLEAVGARRTSSRRLRPPRAVLRRGWHSRAGKGATRGGEEEVHARNEKTGPLLSSHRAPDSSGRTGGLPAAADRGTTGELRGASGRAWPGGNASLGTAHGPLVAGLPWRARTAAHRAARRAASCSGARERGRCQRVLNLFAVACFDRD